MGRPGRRRAHAAQEVTADPSSKSAFAPMMRGFVTPSA